MKTRLLFLFLTCSSFLSAQNFEMPSAKALVNNKFTSLEMCSGPDSACKVFAWYKFDNKGRMIYQKTLHSRDVKSYYTVYTYDRKGRLSTETDRSEDGKFIGQKAYSYLKDSIRIQSCYNDNSDSTFLTLQYWLDPRNNVRRMVSYDKGGYKRSDMGGIFDKKGNIIGSYDSSAQTRIKNEYVFKKYRRISKYDITGNLINVVTLRCDTAGYFNALIDSSIDSQSALHYTITRSPESGLVVSKDGIRLTDADLYTWKSTYGQYHYNDPLIAPGPGMPPMLCYPTAPTYDETGLIRSAVVNNSCYPGDSNFPYTIVYWYK